MSALERLADLKERALAKPKVSREFIADFELVATHYQLREHGEYELAKECARNDIESAIVFYTTEARRLRNLGNVQTGINERIRASIEIEAAA